MSKKTMRRWSLLLVFVMIINMLPMNAMAVDKGQNDNSDIVEGNGNLLDPNNDAYIIDEVIANRTEYSKEFVMSNGLHIAAVYDNAVHYQEDGQWKEIDNTLKLANTRSGNVYTNTAGSWQVSFPQSLTGNNGITISRDAYTLSFRMSGELHETSNGTEMMEADASVEPESEIESGILDILDTEANLSLAQPAVSTDAVIHTADQADVFADVQYEETVVDTIHSELEYADVYDNTDIIFELNSNLVKESIVINQFDATLYGYTYLLDIGEMTPVLTDNGDIELHDANLENVVMVMPAPYLVDNAGEYNYDVQIMLDEMDGSYILSYLLPQEWLADDTREWPVVLDPIVYATTTTSNVRDIAIYSNTYLGNGNGVLQCGNYSNWGVGRIYLKYNQLPKLSPSDVIVAANVTLFTSTTSFDAPRIVEVHKVTDTWASETITWNNKPAPVDTVEDFQICQTTMTYYTWDITDIARGWYNGENTGMMFKVDDASEASTSDTFVQFYSSDYGIYYKPTVLIMFRNNNGLEGYWDYTSSSAGRAGTGYVNQYSGNLVWTHSDIGFGGNRMPVSISHIYNSNDYASNLFGMGNGWRTNFNQRVYKWRNNNAYGDYYVWEDADGTCHYFPYDSESAAYKDEDGMELTLTVTSTGYTITDKNGNTSDFDSNGRLRKQSNNQQTKSTIEITYNSAGFIQTVKDGAGRLYTFHYTNNLLSKISYQGTDYISFEYNGKNLKKIIDKDAAFCQYEYTASNRLCAAIDVDGYKIVYTYAKEETDKPSRVATISEYSGNTRGGMLSIEYGQNETTFTDHNGNKQTVQFNNWGNTISIQDDQGRAQYAQYAINEPVASDDETAAQTETETDNTAKGNQLRLASKMQNTVANLLDNSSFERDAVWTPTHSASVNCSIDTTNAYFGSKSLKVSTSDDSIQAGAYGANVIVNPDETYTFSAYVKTGDTEACLAIGAGSSYEYSEYLAKDADWVRLEVHYTNKSASAQTVHPLVLTKKQGTVWLDCVQLEKYPTASRYNLIENGDFRFATGWMPCSGRATQPVAAPALNSNVYKLVGDPTATNRISQTVQVSGAEGDVFVLAGWALGESVPLDDEREFSLIATFNYTDNTTSKSTIRFNPCVDRWQYAAAPIVAEKAYSSILIEVAYDYNANIAYFDGIQLYKEEFGSSYTYDEKGNVETVTDVQGGTTTYTYDDNNNLRTVKLPDESILTYTYYEGTHNVETATTNSGVTYKFEYDAYGNNTSVSIMDGDTAKITSTATYSDDGNLLVSTTDAAGNVTQYGYDEDTNVLKWVQYPEDSAATRTNYTYDEMYRLASATATTDTGKNLSATYTYTNDLLTEVKTGSTTYSFAYGAFALRSSIKVGDRTLATYTYTNDGNNYLEKLAYGNGDSVKYIYDDYGRVTQQTYEDGDTVTYKYDNSGALATVYDSATGITTTYYYDFAYRMMKYVESDGEDYAHSVSYEYDTINNLTSLVETINGVEYITSYAYDSDNRISSVTSYAYDRDSQISSVTNATTVKSYVYDAYSRVCQQVITNDSTEILTTAYTYRNPTDTTTTGQVEKLTIDAGSFDVEYTYTYDDNGNIKTVSDGTYTTSYVYDTAGQLLQENNQAAGKTWVWEYDNAGNIKTRTEYAYSPDTLGDPVDTIQYTYGDTNGWGDLLTAYGGKGITYDNIGNPVTDGTWTYTWEHGRELASMTSEDAILSYEYNADGIRTTKTVGGSAHNHSYIATVVAATCTEGGYTINECTCGDFYISDATDAIGHFFAPTLCSRCSIESGHIHSYTTSVVAPTCGAMGYTLHECECGYSYKSDYTARKDHFYFSSTATICTRCGYNRSGQMEETGAIKKVYDYTYNGSSLTQMTITTAVDDGTPTKETLTFTSDTVTYNDTIYYYVTNLQGDVIAILDSTGTAVVEYTYDAWGNILSMSDTSGVNLGTLNPLRYRGYVYDQETGLYYLQSRYYDPEVGRFLNADALVSTGQGLLGNNMFAYCLNNPINCTDPNGRCSRFLGFLWKVDCGKSTCPTSKNYANREPSFFEGFLEHMARPRKEGNTFSVGFTAGCSGGGVTAGKSGVLSVDTSHNYAFQETTTMGASTGAGGSAGLVLTYTNATNVHDLEGYSESSGFSIVAIGGLSIDYISFSPSSNPNTTRWGISVVISAGGDLEFHSVENITAPSDSWNPFLALKELVYGG